MEALFIYNKHTKELLQFVDVDYRLFEFLVKELDNDKFIVSYIIAKKETENEIAEE